MHQLVRSLRPVVNHESVLLAPIEPPAVDQALDRLARIAVPLQPCFDLLIGEASDVPAWSEAPGEVPESLEQTECLEFRELQLCLQRGEFWVFRYSSQGHDGETSTQRELLG